MSKFRLGHLHLSKDSSFRRVTINFPKDTSRSTSNCNYLNDYDNIRSKYWYQLVFVEKEIWH